MSKYIIDIDALKDCINLLPIPYRVNGVDMVCLKDVQSMIDKFPKDKYENEYKDTYNKSESNVKKCCRICKHCGIIETAIPNYCIHPNHRGDVIQLYTVCDDFEAK